MDYGFARQDRLEADVCCLMCGRVIGKLCGLVWRATGGQRTSRSIVHLTEFRPSIPGAPSRPVTRGTKFRCSDCGGVGVLEEISVDPVVETLLPDDACPIHREPMLGPGRRPKGCQCGHRQAAA
jgi:hypothetical protein